MKYLKILYFLLGVGLLAVIVGETDIAEVWDRVTEIGWLGLTVVIAIYALAFVVDSITWNLALTAVPLDVRWVARIFAVRMVGESFNNLIPAGGMGGEPAKAVLLKKHYGIGFKDSGASIVLAKTINMVALCIFLVAGFAIMLRMESFSWHAKAVAGVGLAAMLTATFLFFAVQRFRLASLAGAWLGRWPAGARLNDILHHIEEFDARLVAFYSAHRVRFFVAVGLGLINWLLGVAEIYYTMVFLGHPVSWSEAFVIEAVAQMVRMGTFFIPLSIGAQEGAFLVVVETLTGSAVLGLAVGVVRRVREILWIALGLALGAWYGLRRSDGETPNPSGPQG